MRRIIFKKRGCIYRWYNQHIKGGRVWRYQRGNQNPYIEEEQTAQWPKEKVQKGQTTIYTSKVEIAIEKKTSTATDYVLYKITCPIYVLL